MAAVVVHTKAETAFESASQTPDGTPEVTGPPGGHLQEVTGPPGGRDRAEFEMFCL